MVSLGRWLGPRSWGPLPRRRVGVLLITAGLGLAGCQADTPRSHALTPVDVEQLRFESAGEQQRFAKLRSCFAERTRDRGFRHISLGKGYQRVAEYWCRGPGGESLCGGADPWRSVRGAAWYTVKVRYPRDGWPLVGGLEVEMGSNPAQGPWGVALSYRTMEEYSEGPGFRLVFRRLSAAEDELQVELTNVYRFDYGGEEPLTLSRDDYERDLARYLVSATSLRDTALARYDEFAGVVAGGLADDGLRQRVCAEYEGDGVPPTCWLEPITAEGRAKLGVRAQQQIGAQRQAVEQHYQAFYRLLAELVPFEHCWL